MKKLVTIRMAGPSDAEQILDIYAPYVQQSSATFEYTVPSVGEFEQRIRNTLTDLPYILCEIDGELQGYAYASHYRSRAAYQWDCELSIYIREDSLRAGIGKLLYEILLKLLAEMNYVHAYACITTPNDASIAFHKAMGFVQNAYFEQCGFKNGRWYDITWMDYRLNDEVAACSLGAPPKPVKSIRELSEQWILELFSDYENRLETSLQNDIMIFNSFLGI